MRYLKAFLQVTFYWMLFMGVHSPESSCLGPGPEKREGSKRPLNEGELLEFTPIDPEKKSKPRMVPVRTIKKKKVINAEISLRKKGYIYEEGVRKYILLLEIRNIGEEPINIDNIAMIITPQYTGSYISEGAHKVGKQEILHNLKSIRELESETGQSIGIFSNLKKKVKLWTAEMMVKLKRIYLKIQGEEAARFPIKCGESTVFTVKFSVSSYYIVLMGNHPEAYIQADFKLYQRIRKKIGPEISSVSVKFTRNDKKLTAYQVKKFFSKGVNLFSLFFFWAIWVAVFI